MVNRAENVLKKGGGFLVEEVNADEVITPEDFTEEQVMMGRTTEDFVEKEVLPQIERIENQEFEISRQLLVKAGELGLLGAEVPEEYGGLGLDKISASGIFRNR